MKQFHDTFLNGNDGNKNDIMTVHPDKSKETTSLRNRRRSSKKSKKSSVTRLPTCTWTIPEDDTNDLDGDDEPSNSQVRSPKFRRDVSRRLTFSPMDFSLDDDDDNDDGDTVARTGTMGERVLDLIDHIEDDITRQSWMQYLIPKNVTLFFENYMLGWNLGSDVLEGVLFPLLCAGVTFWCFTFVAVRFHSGDQQSGDDGLDTAGFWFPMQTMTLHSPFLDLLRIIVTWLSANISYRTVESLGTVVLGSKKPEDVADATTLMEKLKKRPLMEKLKKRRIKKLALDVDKKIKEASDRFGSNFSDLDSDTVNTFLTLSEPLSIVPYSHGGYFGSAPIMMNDPLWIDILRTLMPDVYVEVASRIDHPPSQLIHWAENNPVVAAYGTWTELKKSGCLTPIEWDVFLDPGMVERLEALLDEKESGSSHRSDLEQDISRCTSLLLDKMMIAHGNTFQLVLEQTGIFKRYVYSRVKRTRRALGGGIFAKHWLAVYARALEMVAMKEVEKEGNEVTVANDDYTPSVSASRPYRPSFSRHISLHSLTYNIVNPNMTIEQSLLVLSTLLLSDDDCDSDDDDDDSDDDESISQPPPLSLVLDVKSRFVPQRTWARIVNRLRSSGAEVDGIGSFVPDEIHGIGRLTNVSVGEWIFGHTAGDIQKMCHAGKLRVGDVVFFNAGSLLWDWGLEEGESRWGGIWRWMMEDFDQEKFKKRYKVRSYANFDDNGRDENDQQQPQPSDTLRRRRGSTLKDYKDAYQLSIGLYLQEFAIDECAVDFLFRFVNKHADIFDRGMAWGCPSGVTVDGIHPSKYMSTDGLWSQRFAGAKWDTNLFPET